MTSATLVAVSHGTADPRGQAVVRRLVEAVRGRLTRVEVVPAFVDVEEPSLSEVLAHIDGPVTVVPLLLGAGFHVHVDIATAVQNRVAAGLPTTTAATLGPDAALTGVLLDRLHRVEVSDRDAVVLAVAGSSDIRARLGADRAAALLSARLRRRVRVGHLGGAGRPLDRVLAEARAGSSGGGRVVAANYLLAPGFFTDRLNASAADVVTGPLAAGVRLDPRLVDLVVRRFEAGSQRRLSRAG
jgi:sirohydrochlorin ferrochelatase